MANQKPRPEEIWVWQTWYKNAAAPVWRCNCCGNDINLGTAYWELQRSFRTWYIMVPCRMQCENCALPGAVFGSCKNGVRFNLPVVKPPQAAGVDYRAYNSNFPRQPSDAWRAKADVLPRLDGIYQTKGDRLDIDGGYVGTEYLRFNATGQVFGTYSSGSAIEVAGWIGQEGLDYEATGNSFSAGLYSVEKCKITLAFPSHVGKTELTAIQVGTINRGGTALDLVNAAKPKAKLLQSSYKFQAIRGM